MVWEKEKEKKENTTVATQSPNPSKSSFHPLFVGEINNLPLRVFLGVGFYFLLSFLFYSSSLSSSSRSEDLVN